jgi:hypothetical protein
LEDSFLIFFYNYLNDYLNSDYLVMGNYKRYLNPTYGGVHL